MKVATMIILSVVMLIIVWVLVSSGKKQNSVSTVPAFTIKDIKEGTPIQWDSTYTAISYSMNWISNDHRFSTARKGTVELLLPKPGDATRNEIFKVVVYQVPLFVDSVVNGKRFIDSTGKVIQKQEWFIVDPSAVLQDYNKNFKVGFIK